MSELRTNTLSNAAGTGPAVLTGQSAAKAWANLDGTGTIVLRDDFNVASVTDNGIGDYTFNYSKNMTSSSYVFGVTGANNSTYEVRHYNTLTRSASAAQVRCQNNSGSGFQDASYVGMSIHGDLA